MKLTIEQAIDLELELRGFKNESETCVGLLNEKLGMRNKYWLNKILKKVSKERETFFEVEKSLFISLGCKEVDGRLMIEEKLEDGSPNPAYKKVTEERQKLLSEVIDLGDIHFDISEFDFETESNYDTFFDVAFGAEV